MNLEDINVFLQIVSSGSLSQAARIIRRPKASISHQLKRLEDQLGSPLFERSANHLKLNEAGSDFLEHAKNIRRACQRGIDSARRSRKIAAGKIKIASSGEFTSNLLGPLSLHFSGKYPDISMEVMVFRGEALLEVRDQFDCLLYLGEPPVPQFSDMTARHLGKFSFALYASQHYLDKRQKPLTPNELFDHNLIGFHGNNAINIWQLNNGKEAFNIQPDSKFLTNDYWLAKLAAIHNQGICFVPTFFAHLEESAGLLTRVLPEWQSLETPMYALFSSHRISNPYLRALIDTVVEHFDEIFSYPYVASYKNSLAKPLS